MSEPEAIVSELESVRSTLEDQLETVKFLLAYPPQFRESVTRLLHSAQIEATMLGNILFELKAKASGPHESDEDVLEHE